MGIKGGHRNNNYGFGNLVSLRPVTYSSSPPTISTTNNNAKSKVHKPTRTIKISEHTFRLFVGHSKRYYDVESYDLILENLLKCYEEHNQDTRWYHNNTDR